ncbi:hypothetical protein AB4120_18725 [Cupriavidus sp. 2KB_3]|uniref:hypothetical protein n=1 Tax=Cupriavidus sp. 2KB_3 TaxID=3232980 RepID=UPI003F907F6E
MSDTPSALENARERCLDAALSVFPVVHTCFIFVFAVGIAELSVSSARTPLSVLKDQTLLGLFWGEDAKIWNVEVWAIVLSLILVCFNVALCRALCRKFFLKANLLGQLELARSHGFKIATQVNEEQREKIIKVLEREIKQRKKGYDGRRMLSDLAFSIFFVCFFGSVMNVWCSYVDHLLIYISWPDVVVAGISICLGFWALFEAVSYGIARIVPLQGILSGIDVGIVFVDQGEID